MKLDVESRIDSRMVESTRISLDTAALVQTPPASARARLHSSRRPSTKPSSEAQLYRSKIVLVAVILVEWTEIVFSMSIRRAISSGSRSFGSCVL
jgi:hypothetical protein